MTVGVGVVGKQKMMSMKVIQSTATIEMGRLYEKKETMLQLDPANNQDVIRTKMPSENGPGLNSSLPSHLAAMGMR